MQKNPTKHSLENSKPQKMLLSYFGFLFIMLSLICLDQSTKYLSEKYYLLQFSQTDIRSYLPSAHSIFTLGDLNSNWLHFSVTYARNTGAAWAFLGNLPENIRPYFFYILTIVAMIVILFFFFKTNSKNILTRCAITFIFGGASGNFIDRAWLHYVIDWLHFEWRIFGWYYDYPVFNIADSAVVCGVILLFMDSILEEKKLRRLQKQNKTLNQA